MHPVAPVTSRSRLVLEIASELVGVPSFEEKQAQVLLRAQGAEGWAVSLFGSDAPDALELVARKEVTLGIVNPSALLTVACRGVHPFRGPLPLRAINVIPSRDQLVFAVGGETGLSSLDDVASARYPLRLSLRGQRDHSVHLVLDHVLQAAGWSLGDLRCWGGSVDYDEGLPGAKRLGRVAEGAVDAIFDEAATTWVDNAIELGMRILTISPATLDRLETWGYRRARLASSRHPGLAEDLETVDFSGFAVFVHENLPGELVTMFCESMERRHDRIPLQTDRPLPLAEMCAGGDAAPLGVPLHPAAEQFWSDRGYLQPQ